MEYICYRSAQGTRKEHSLSRLCVGGHCPWPVSHMHTPPCPMAVPPDGLVSTREPKPAAEKAGLESRLRKTAGVFGCPGRNALQMGMRLWELC